MQLTSTRIVRAIRFSLLGLAILLLPAGLVEAKGGHGGGHGGGHHGGGGGGHHSGGGGHRGGGRHVVSGGHRGGGLSSAAHRHGAAGHATAVRHPASPNSRLATRSAPAISRPGAGTGTGSRSGMRLARNGTANCAQPQHQPVLCSTQHLE